MFPAYDLTDPITSIGIFVFVVWSLVFARGVWILFKTQIFGKKMDTSVNTLESTSEIIVNRPRIANPAMNRSNFLGLHVEKHNCKK